MAKWHGERAPQTDEEVMALIENDWSGTTMQAVKGMYRCFRALGQDVLEAWMSTLDKILEGISK